MTKWYRMSVLLKVLETAAANTLKMSGSNDERQSEKFISECHDLSKANNIESYIIDSNNLLRGKTITDFFFKTHLLLTGYNINVHTDFNHIVNKILVS